MPETGASKSKGAVDNVEFTKIIEYIFSWVVILPICLIVSGKLIAQSFDYKVDSSDVLNIDLRVIKIKAEKQEVSLGFGLYFLIFFINLIFTRDYTVNLINEGADLNISKWNALCIFSGLCSASISMIVFTSLVLIPRLLPSRKLISTKEQSKIIKKIQSQRSSNKDKEGE